MKCYQTRWRNLSKAISVDCLHLTYGIQAFERCFCDFGKHALENLIKFSFQSFSAYITTLHKSLFSRTLVLGLKCAFNRPFNTQYQFIALSFFEVLHLFLIIQKKSNYLTIRPRGRMDYESTAHEAVGQMSYSNS